MPDSTETRDAECETASIEAQSSDTADCDRLRPCRMADEHHLPTAQVDPISAAIRDIMRESQQLSSAGWHGGANVGAQFHTYRLEMLLQNFREMVGDALVDLASRRIPADASSYGQKHICERRVKRYVTNGAFIVAALIAGYSVKRTGHGPNCCFTKPRDARPHPSICGGDYSRGWGSADRGASA